MRSLILLVALSAPALADYQGHGADSITPEVLARFAPKPLAAAVSRRIQSMLDVRAPGGGIVSPDGKSLYFDWSVTGNSQIWMLDGPRRFPVQLTGGEDRTWLASITPDGKHLIVQRDRKGEENPGLYLMDPAGGPLVEIQHTPKVQTEYQFTSDDSRFIYFASNDVKPDSYAIYRWEIATAKKERVFGEDGIWSVADHRADGKLLLNKATGSLSSEIFEWDGQKLTPIVGQGEKEEYTAEWSAHDLVIMTNKPGDFRRLYKFAGGKLELISADVKADVEGFTLDRAKKHLYYVVNVGGFTRTHVLDGATFKELPIPAFKEYDHVSFGAPSRNGNRVVFSLESARAPRMSMVYDWTTKKLTEWVVPSSPEIDTRRFAVAKLEEYPARDGTMIPMFVRRPEGCDSKVCPVVVAFHGGPEGQARPGFSTSAQLFVDAGFVFVEPNVRGSMGYGKSWLRADDGPKRLNVITDIEDCAKFIRANWHATKVGVYGGSYGGYSTLVAMTMFAGAYDAGAEVVGMSNLYTFLMNTAPYRRILRISEYGDPEKDRDALAKLSPITYLDKLKAPLLMIQGASDPRVPVGEALQFHAALEKRKVPARLIIFPDEGHGAQKRDNRVIQMGEVINFFEQQLK